MTLETCSMSSDEFSQFSSVTQLCPTLWPHGLQYARPPCPSPTSRVYSNSCPLSWWCHPTILSSVVPLSCLKSFPTSGYFPMGQLFISGNQNIGVSTSASVLPTNIQDWFHLGWTDWTSLQSKRLKVFPHTIFQNDQFFSAQLYGPILIPIHDYRKHHSLDEMDLCWQSNVSAFLYAV